MTCLAVVCRAVLFGMFVLAGFLVVSAFEAATAAADTECGPIDAVTAPTACPVTSPVTSLVDATVGQTTALVDSTAPVLAPAIDQVDSAVRTATTATIAITETVDTVVRDVDATVSRTLEDPITNTLSGAVSGTASVIAPVVSGAVLPPLPAMSNVATVTVTVVSTTSHPNPRPTPPTTATPAAPRTTPAAAPQQALTAPAAAAPAAPLGGDRASGVSRVRGQGSFQWPTASATQAGAGSQRPVGHLPLDFPAAPVGAVGSGNGTSQAGFSGGHAQGAIVLPGRAAHDQRLASWSVTPDDVAKLRERAQQPPVSPD